MGSPWILERRLSPFLYPGFCATVGCLADIFIRSASQTLTLPLPSSFPHPHPFSASRFALLDTTSTEVVGIEINQQQMATHCIRRDWLKITELPHLVEGTP